MLSASFLFDSLFLFYNIIKFRSFIVWPCIANQFYNIQGQSQQVFSFVALFDQLQ